MLRRVPGDLSDEGGLGMSPFGLHQRVESGGEWLTCQLLPPDRLAIVLWGQ
jgi:hypothetical protein